MQEHLIHQGETMSKPDNIHNITTVNSDSVPTETVEKKSRLTKTKKFITKHKKPLIAAGLLAGVVTLSAKVGRSTAPSIDSPQDPEPDYTEEMASMAFEADTTA